MDSLIADNIQQTSKNLDALNHAVLNNDKLLVSSVVLYAQRLASRYRLMCARTCDVLARFESDPSELHQSELADAALLFKSDNELFEHVMKPILYWIELDKRCRERKLSICNYHEYTFAMELVQAISLAVGVRFFSAHEEPVKPESLIEMVAHPVISQIISNEALAEQGLNQDVKSILCHRIVGIDDRSKRHIHDGFMPEQLTINFEYMRKILHKITQY